MTLQFTIALAYAAAANGCTFCVVHEASRFELDCMNAGGHVRTFAASQTCVMDAGTGAAAARLVDDDGGGEP